MTGRTRVVRVNSKRPPVEGVRLVRHDVDDPSRRRELERLLQVLIDQPAPSMSESGATVGAEVR